MYGLKSICNNCEYPNFTIKLMPDYESNGLWCAKCGIMLDDEVLNLPEDLINRIKKWNDNWDDYNTKNNYNNIAPKGFNLEGLKLAMEINKYHPCLYYISKEEE